MKKIFVLLIAAVAALCGCSAQDVIQNNLMALNNDVTEESDAQREKKLEDAIIKIDGVNDASVSISGQTALIGIRTRKSADASENLRLKSLASKKARQTDLGIKNVAITSNPEIMEMIEKTKKI